MCYAIPGKVHAVEGNIVVVDYFGEYKRARFEMCTLAPGDYVLAQGGYVIQKVDAAEAEKTLTEWKDLFFALKEIDAKKVQGTHRQKPLSRLAIERILSSCMQEKPLSDDEAQILLELQDEESQTALYQTANALRQRFHDNACCVHGIIEISNHCQRACHYCGISTWNKPLKRYRMNRDEILEAVREAVDVHSFHSLVLQSGEDQAYSIEELCDVIAEIKRRHAVLLIASFGEVGREGLEKLYKAGCRGLLMRFETSNPGLYQKLHPGTTLASRIDELKYATKLGFFLITGGLVGLPGQTAQDMINDIRLAASLQPEMLSFGPFLAHPHTPLEHVKPVSEAMMFNVLALSRIIAASQAKVLVTTAFETLSPRAREQGLMAGGSSVMLNVTPFMYRKLYTIYPDRAHTDESVEQQIKETVNLLGSLGRAPTDLSI